MASLTAGYSFGSTESVTNTKLGLLVSAGTVTGIVNADVDASAAISDTKLDLATIAQAMQFNGATTVAALMSFSSVACNMAKGSDIASATTTDIGAAVGNYVHVTGTTTITGLGTIQAGTWRLVRFTGALTFTHNGTSLILPTAANITTAADDHALMISLGSGNWICANYARKSGIPLVAFTAATAPAGTVLQVVNGTLSTAGNNAANIPNDTSIPQSNEGTEILTKAITPSNSSNLLHIIITVHLGNSGATNRCIAALFQDSTANALAVASEVCNSTSAVETMSFDYWMTAGTASATTFKLRVGGDSGTGYWNQSSDGKTMGNVYQTTITITEIKA